MHLLRHVLGACFALTGHSGPEELGHTEFVIGLDTEQFFDLDAGGPWPRLGTVQADLASGVLGQIKALLLSLLSNVKSKGRSGAEGMNRQVHKNVDHTIRLPAGQRYGCGAHSLRAVMESESACGKPVPEGVQEDVSRAGTNHPEFTGVPVGPKIDIVLVGKDEDRLACGSRSTVHLPHLRHIACDDLCGITVPDGPLLHKWNLADILQGLQVAWVKTGVIVDLLEIRVRVINVANLFFKEIKLKLLEFIDRHGLDLWLKVWALRILSSRFDLHSSYFSSLVIKADQLPPEPPGLRQPLSRPGVKPHYFRYLPPRSGDFEQIGELFGY